MPFDKGSRYDIVEPKYSMSYTLGPSGYGVPRPRYPLTSIVEIRDILAAIGALTIAFYLAMSSLFQDFKWPYSLGISALIVVVGFFVHEMSHKAVARKYGCWAEFRAYYPMLGLAIMMAFLGFLWAAPGAVMIAGNVSREQNGKISLAGPGSNLLVAFVLVPFALLSVQGVPDTVRSVALLLCLFSVILAGFNLIPIMPFDGAKIWAWNKPIYIMALLATGALGVLFIQTSTSF